MSDVHKVVPQELGKFSEEDLIPDEQVVVTLTSANYIKRSPMQLNIESKIVAVKASVA